MTQEEEYAERPRAAKKVVSLIENIHSERRKATETFRSQDSQIREHCMRLKNQVDYRSEVLIEEIRLWNETMRKEIDKYESQCLGQFDKAMFKTRANNLLNEMDKCEKRIDEHIADAKSNTNTFKLLFNETLDKLRYFKTENVMLYRQKFAGKVPLEFQVREENKKLDLTSLGTLVEQSKSHSLTIHHDYLL